jgi:Uma2 family endonuclease
MALPAAHEHFTFGVYCTWPEGERWELIDGVPYAMSPAPDWPHQSLVATLTVAIGNHLKGKPCRVLPAPLDVLLPKADEADDLVDTVVQPDLVVLCDSSKLTRHGVRGAPEWVIEILSPSTASRDQREKRELYERHGVAEYWIVSPTERLLWAYRLEGGVYGKPAIYDEAMTASPQAFPDLAIALTELFADIPRSE